MKTLIAATAMLMLFASVASAQDRTQEYRMWSADQMIKQIAEKMVRTRKACDQAEWLVGQRLSEKCIASVVSTYPLLGKIRDVASSGDTVVWAKLIDAVHQWELRDRGAVEHPGTALMSVLLKKGMTAPMSTHTPGPWDVSHVGHSQPLPCDFRVHTESGATRDEWEANARLIAAAPDLPTLR